MILHPVTNVYNQNTLISFGKVNCFIVIIKVTDLKSTLSSALFVVEKNSTEFLPKVKPEFKQWLKLQWLHEKRRRKESSARHKALSKTLSLMKIPHFNEHDDIGKDRMIANSIRCNVTDICIHERNYFRCGYDLAKLF